MSALASRGRAAAEPARPHQTDLDRLFDRLVAELRATSGRMAAGRAAVERQQGPG